MNKKNFKDIESGVPYSHQLMHTITPDGDCYVYALSDLLGKRNPRIRFYEVELNAKFHFSVGAVKALYECLEKDRKNKIKKMADLWSKSCNNDLTLLCAPVGTKTRSQLKKNEYDKASDYFIDSVCYWGSVVRTIGALREYFDKHKNREKFIAKIKERLDKKGEAAYEGIDADCKCVHGMDLSIYTKCLRIIKPEKFFIVDLVYEQFFKVKRKNYLEYKRAFQEVLDELKNDGFKLQIGDFEHILYFLIQYARSNTHNKELRQSWSNEK